MGLFTKKKEAPPPAAAPMAEPEVAPPPPPPPERVETPHRRREVSVTAVLHPHSVHVDVGRDVTYHGKIHESHVTGVVVGLHDEGRREHGRCYRLHQDELDVAPKMDLEALADRIRGAKTLLDVADAFADAFVDEASR